MIKLFIRRPVFTTMLVMLLVVFGVTSYPSLGIDLYPDVDFPIVTVRITYTGASPEEIARLTEELKAALDEYLKAMAEAAAGDPSRLGDLGQNGEEPGAGRGLQHPVGRSDRRRRHRRKAKRDRGGELLEGLGFLRPACMRRQEPGDLAELRQDSRR